MIPKTYLTHSLTQTEKNNSLQNKELTQQRPHMKVVLTDMIVKKEPREKNGGKNKQQRLASSSQRSSCLLSTGIKGVCQHCLAELKVLSYDCTLESNA